MYGSNRHFKSGWEILNEAAEPEIRRIPILNEPS
jgi:hypothetical protein